MGTGKDRNNMEGTIHRLSSGRQAPKLGFMILLTLYVAASSGV